MFGLTGIQVKIAEFVVAAFLCFAAYQYVGHEAVSHYKDEVAAAQAKADKIQQDKYNTLSQQYEDLKTKRQENAKVIQKETERIITNQPIYTTTCINQEGLDLINKAIRGQN